MTALGRLLTVPLIGLIVGGLFGSMLGAGENRYKNKTERELTGGISIGIFGILGCVVGLFGGFWIANALNEDDKKQKIAQAEQAKAVQEYTERMQREQRAKQHLGLDKAVTDQFKEGRYWVAETKWTDGHIEHSLRTAKNKEGQLTSIYDTVEFIDHNQSSAAQDIVRTSHSQAERQLNNFLITQWLNAHKTNS